MFITIIIFIVILGILIFVHEFGHFIVAKRSGMKVDEFGFGFPPRIFGLQNIAGKWKIIWGHKAPLDIEQTVYSINWIPLGGFVKIVGENNDQADDPRSFTNKPFWPRFFTLVAGVVMNVILAWALYSAGYMAGLPVAINSPEDLPKGANFTEQKIAILEVVKNLPADISGLKPNDVILSIDGQNFSEVGQIRDYINRNAGKQFSFKVRRGAEQKNISVASNAYPPAGEGSTGVALALVGKLRLPWYLSVGEGLKSSISQLGNIVSGFGHLLTSKVGLESLGGPVKIAKLTGEVAGMGFIYLLQFTAFLSLNLAVINVLPFPALDGGRVLFLIIEKIRRKRNNQKVEAFANTAGFLFLVILMVLVTIKDIFVK